MAAQPPQNKNVGNTNQEDSHLKLKRKYTALMQTHRKLLDDYELALDVITKLSSEKSYLKDKLNEVLNKAGFQVQQFQGLEEMGQ